MSAGTLLLTIAAILVYCGLLQRVLDRMYLMDRQALLVIGVAFNPGNKVCGREFRKCLYQSLNPSEKYLSLVSSSVFPIIS